MTGIRCQLCDGFIVNGRCKTCGMPYRNDEVLYHLNESRHDHYKHATPKARSMMRDSVIPLGDKPSYKNNQKGNSGIGNAQNRSLQNRNVQSRTGGTISSQDSGRLMSKEQIKAQQEKVRQEAMAKINTTNVPKRTAVTKDTAKKKGLGGFWWIIILLYIIIGFFGGMF